MTSELEWLFFDKCTFFLKQARHENEERKRLAREAAATLERPPKRPLNKRSQVCREIFSLTLFHQ